MMRFHLPNVINFCLINLVLSASISLAADAAKTADVKPFQFGFFNSDDRTDSIGEKSDAAKPVVAADPAIPVTTTTPVIVSDTTAATTKKGGKKNNNGGKVQVVIAAPVSTKTDNITDGLFVDPADNTFNIAIGGANISFDLSGSGAATSSNQSKTPLNGEQLPENMKRMLPEFLRKANDSSRRSFFDIENNGNIKKCYYLQALMNWADVQSADVKNSFTAYVEQLKTEKQANREKQASMVASMSNAAQKANTQIQAIIDNDQISKNEENTQINTLLASLPKKVQKELNKLDTN